jgi:hypothetical protein
MSLPTVSTIDQSTATGAGITPSAPVAGLDVLSHSLRDADSVAHAVVHQLHDLGALDALVATHVVATGHEPHHVLTVSATQVSTWELQEILHEVGARFDVASILVGGDYTGPPELRHGLEAAIASHVDHTSGRVVVFPGDHLLVGTVDTHQVTSQSDVDRVVLVTGGDVADARPLVTRNFLRPLWHDGDLVLHVQEAIGGTLVPFETPSPTPCCADHA